LLIASLLAFLAYIARMTDVTHDAFHEMALAQVWWTTGEFPRDDVFAFTPTVSPTVHHEWGTGLVLFWVTENSPLGLHGMAVLRLVLVCGLAAMLYRIARNQGAHPYLVAACAPIAFPFLWVGFANLRAQLFTLVFLAVQVLMLQSDVRGRRTWVLGWFVLYVLWLNMHAGFVVGIALLGLHVTERWCGAILWDTATHQVAPRNLISLQHWQKVFERYWHHLLLLPMIVAGVGINPWGWAYVPYLARAILMPRSSMLEWQPLWMTYSPWITMAAFATSVWLLVYIAMHRRWDRLGGWLFCCLAAYMACKHLRHGSLYGMVWLGLMPGWLTPTPLGKWIVVWLQTARRPALTLATLSILGCGAFITLHQPWRSHLPSDDPAGLMVYPVDACQFLQSQGWKGNMITPFATGGYVSWRCYPSILVSIDGRYEVAYPEEALMLHDRFYAAEPGWDRMLSMHDVDLILVQRTAPVRSSLIDREHRRQWQIVHEDSAFTLFAKRKFLARYQASSIDSQ
jgi:hypothetical protein